MNLFNIFPVIIFNKLLLSCLLQHVTLLFVFGYLAMGKATAEAKHLAVPNDKGEYINKLQTCKVLAEREYIYKWIYIII